MASLPMAAQPGEKFVYGYNTDILGVIVEKLSGKSLQEFLDERLIKPLGMKDTSFYLPREKAGRLAVVGVEADPADQDVTQNAAVSRGGDERELGHEVRAAADSVDQFGLVTPVEGLAMEVVDEVEIDRLLRADRPLGRVDKIGGRQGERHARLLARGAPVSGP